MKYGLVAAAGIFFSCVVQAQVYRGPVSSAIGGAGRAGVVGGEAGLLNPALVALLKANEINTYYRDGALLDGQHQQAIGLGASDNSPDTYFPGSLHYLRLRDHGPSVVNGELWHAAIGQLGWEKFGLGISGYRLISDVVGDKQYEQWNYSIGTLFVISEDFGLAYVLDNVAKPGGDVPAYLRQEMQQTLSFFAGIKDFARLHADVSRQERFNADKKLAYGFGLETQSSEFLIIRAGYRQDDLRDMDVISAGIGFNGPRLKMDYTFEKAMEGSSGALHSVDMRLPF